MPEQKSHAAVVRGIKRWIDLDCILLPSQNGTVVLSEIITREYDPLVKACQQEHCGKHFDPECPICIALKEVVGE